MESFVSVIAVLALVVAALALWRVTAVTKDVKRIRRDHYYLESRVKRVPEDIAASVEPLRWQVSNISTGKPVVSELIRSGRLYVDIPAAEAQQILDMDGRVSDIMIVDVRTPKEYAARRIPGAKLVPFEELDQRYRDEISDQAEKVFVYCSSGERSRLACDFLGRRGYTNLYNIHDGLRQWRGPTEGEGEVTFIKLELKR